MSRYVFLCCCYNFFFFKQKTAYEMRISDWSSDVCSSDLLGLDALLPVDTPIEDAVQTALAELQPVVRLSIPVDIATAADGTSASVTASLLRVEILPPEALGAAEPLADVLNQILGAIGADLAAPLLSLDLAPIAASAVAPAGGIDCGGDLDNPLRELNKHASALEVAPGGTFHSNIPVPHRGRSEERRVGKEVVRPCSTRGWPY